MQLKQRRVRAALLVLASVMAVYSVAQHDSGFALGWLLVGTIAVAGRAR